MRTLPAAQFKGCGDPATIQTYSTWKTRVGSQPSYHPRLFQPGLLSREEERAWA